MSPSAEVARQVPSLVRRARAGDQNAMATIARVGQEARKGTERAKVAYKAINKYIQANPAQAFKLTPDTAVVMDTPPSKTRAPRDPELSKPPVPRGAFKGIFDPDTFAIVIVRACQYRHGLDAAAVVLATGPLLTQPVVTQIGMSNFGSDDSSNMFFHGVKYPDAKSWQQIAPYVDASLRRCLALGQCIGRARKLQAVRMQGSPISAYSEVAGWELGE